MSYKSEMMAMFASQTNAVGVEPLLHKFSFVQWICKAAGHVSENALH